MQSIGLPAPAQVSLLGEPWTAAKYHLQFTEKSGIPDVVLRRILYWDGTQPLEIEAAALQHAQFIDELPVCDQYRVLSREFLPWPAAVHTYIQGRSGQDLIQENPAYSDAVATAIGEILAQLAEKRMSRFGTRIDAGQFAPARASWKAEWQAITGHFLSRINACGVALEPAINTIKSELDERWGALDSVSEFSLVHSDLKPSNVLFQGDSNTLKLTGVIDWEGAMAGDPLIDWALHIQRSNTSLVQLVKSYGPERVRTFLQPEALARLQIYIMTRSLAGLAHVHSEMFYGDYGVRRSWVLEWMRLQMRNQREQRIKQSLQAALDATVEHLALVKPQLKTYRLELWQTLEALRFAPLNTSPRIEPLLGALGACFVARDTPEFGVGWRNIAKGAIRHMGPQSMPFPQDEIPDRKKWKQYIVGRVLETMPIDEDQGHCLSIATLGLCFSAFDDLDWTLSDGHLRGLETLLEGLILIEEQRRKQSASVQTRLTHGLLSWAALLWLKEHDSTLWTRWDEALDKMETQTLDAWQDLVIHNTGSPTELQTEDVIRIWPHTAGLREAGSAIPAVLWALQKLMHEDALLSTQAGSLWRLLDIPTSKF